MVFGTFKRSIRQHKTVAFKRDDTFIDNVLASLTNKFHKVRLEMHVR